MRRSLAKEVTLRQARQKKAAAHLPAALRPTVRLITVGWGVSVGPAVLLQRRLRCALCGFGPEYLTPLHLATGRSPPFPSAHLAAVSHEGRSYDWTGRQGFGSWIWIRGRRASVFLCGNVLVRRASHAPHPPPRFLAARRGAGGRQAPGLQVGGSCGAMGWGLARSRPSEMGGKLLGRKVALFGNTVPDRDGTVADQPVGQRAGHVRELG